MSTINDQFAVQVMGDHAWFCVARGAAWLDECYPGWREHISNPEVDLSVMGQCVLGQIAPEHARFHPSVPFDRREACYWSFIHPSARGEGHEPASIYGTTPHMLSPVAAVMLGFDIDPLHKREDELALAEALSVEWRLVVAS